MKVLSGRVDDHRAYQVDAVPNLRSPADPATAYLEAFDRRGYGAISSTDGPTAISINDAIGTLTFLPDRRPTTTPEESKGAFALLSAYRDGGIFVGHWAGTSEWERHTVGDEIVMVLDGETTIFFLTDDGEPGATLRAGEFVVVPQGTWHRFETPEAVKLLSVTPQPTDHRSDHPRSAEEPG